MTGHSADQIADRYVDESCALDPYLATTLGVDAYQSAHPDFSLGGYLRRSAHDRRVLADLLATTPTDPRETVAREALVERLAVNIDYHEVGLDRMLNAQDCPIQQIPVALNLMPRHTSSDWADILGRLQSIPEVLAGYRETVHEDLDVRIAPALRQVRRVSRQCTSLGDKYFTKRFTKPGSGVDVDVDELRKAARRAERAYRSFRSFLRDEVAERSRRTDAIGQDRYQVASRFFLGSTIDLPDAYRWSLDELERLEREMAQVANEIVSGASLQQAFEELEVRSRYQAATPTLFVDWMQALTNRVIEGLAAVYFAIPEAAQTLLCQQDPASGGRVVYTPPGEGFSRPARLLWSVAPGEESIETWDQTVSVFYEGVPGRHVYTSTTMSADSLNRWQRQMSWVPGHEEGWAGYATILMRELGWFADPGELLGALDAQRQWTARMVADIGLHCDLAVPASIAPVVGDRWDPDAVARFLRNHTRLSAKTLAHRMDKYLGYPGHVLSHRIGEKVWLATREQVRRNEGDDFDLKSFHNRALALGPMGLDPFRAAMTAS